MAHPGTFRKIPAHFGGRRKCRCRRASARPFPPGVSAAELRPNRASSCIFGTLSASEGSVGRSTSAALSVSTRGRTVRPVLSASKRQTYPESCAFWCTIAHDKIRNVRKAPKMTQKISRSGGIHVSPFAQLSGRSAAPAAWSCGWIAPPSTQRPGTLESPRHDTPLRPPLTRRPKINRLVTQRRRKTSREPPSPQHLLNLKPRERRRSSAAVSRRSPAPRALLR